MILKVAAHPATRHLKFPLQEFAPSLLIPPLLVTAQLATAARLTNRLYSHRALPQKSDYESIYEANLMSAPKIIFRRELEK